MRALGFILAVFTQLGWAHTYPDSYRYQVLVSDKTTSTVTKTSFLTIPNIIHAIHQNELKKNKLSVVVNTDWEKPYFTAWANPEKENHYSLNFWGGLARIPGMNDEAFAITACHELGHILGGTPKIKNIDKFLWSSTEGQCDYYATSICIKNYFKFINKSKKLTAPKKLSETAYTLCRTTYSNELDFLICLNTNKGIEGFASMLEHLSQYKETYAIDTPSSVRVKQTLDSYPDTQCRVDTLLRGSLNQKRPSCWFKTN